MKVLTMPESENIEVQGTIIVCRWGTGHLTAFRYHYDGKWYCVSETKAYSTKQITKSSTILAAFFD